MSRNGAHFTIEAPAKVDKQFAPIRGTFARTETLTRSATKLTQTSEIARTSELPGFAVAMVTANGAAYAYSNIGAALAGLALEGNAGRSFAGRSREIVLARWV